MPDPIQPLNPKVPSITLNKIVVPQVDTLGLLQAAGTETIAPTSKPGVLSTRRAPGDPTGPNPEPKPVTATDRITPYLVMKMHPNDVGARGPADAIDSSMPTLTVSGGGQGNVASHLSLGQSYQVSAVISNLGQAPVLMGMASLYIVDGATFKMHWNKPFGPAFCVQPFRMGPGRDAAIHFPRAWTAAPLSAGFGADNLVMMYVHVQDMAGDAEPFTMTTGFADRHTARRDFTMS